MRVVASAVVLLALFACQRPEPPAGAIGARCGDTSECTEGIDPRCIDPENECGLGPPGYPCDSFSRCRECGGDEPDDYFCGQPELTSGEGEGEGEG